MEKANFKYYLKERMTNKGFVAINGVYIIFCLVSSILCCIDFQPRNFLMSLFFVLFVPVVLIAEYAVKIRLGELFIASAYALAAGSILGSCFNVYTTVPFFDTVLHGISGVLFAALGFAIAEKFFGKVNDDRNFFGSLLLGFCFSLAIAVLWEIFEYGCTAAFGFDMMEDSIVTHINSYLLSGNHTETVELDGIVKTVIYYGEGKTYTIDGYLDIGLIDTLTDMIICTVGAAIFAIISTLSYKKCPKINQMLIPQITEKSACAEQK